MKRLYKLAFGGFLLLGQITTIVAQTPVKLKDLKATIRDVANLGETMFFAADDGLMGKELWKTDGSEAGTVQVKDIFPGNRTSSSNPQQFYVHKGIVFFQARPTSVSYKLFKSDGTAAGTQQVTNKFNASINFYFVYKDKLYFIQDDVFLWTTDGTDAGTLQIARLPGGVDGWAFMKDKIYFKLRSGANEHLFECDGTSVGTKEIKKFPASSFAANMVALNNTLYFEADDGTYGSELWKSDGTEAGTVMVRNIGTREEGSSPGNFVIAGNKVFFTTKPGQRATLWQTDGTEAGTLKITDANGREFITNTPERDLIWGSIGNKVYAYCFALRDNVYAEDFGLYVFNATDGSIKNPYLSNSGKLFSLRDYQMQKDHLLLLSYVDNTLKIDISRLSPITDSSTVLGSFITNGLALGGWQMLGQGIVFPYDESYGTYGFYRVSFCSHTAKINTPNGASFCPGSSVNIVAEGSGATGGYTYNWKQGTSNAGTNATLTVNKAGTYTVEVTDNKGCLVATSVEITQTTNLPVAIGGASSFCAGQTTPLSVSATGGSGSYSYQWRLNGGVITGATASTLAATTTGTYSVSVVDARGCTGTSSNLSVTQKPSPNATITTNTGSTTYLTGNTVTLSTPAATGQTYQWLKDSQPIAGATNNTYVVSQPGNYAVTVTRDGCSATSTPTPIALILALEPGLIGIGMEISPNPSTDACTVKLILEKPSSAQVSLLDAVGKPVRQWVSGRVARSHEAVLSLGDLPAGLYLVQAVANDKKAVMKLIRQ